MATFAQSAKFYSLWLRNFLVGDEEKNFSMRKILVISFVLLTSFILYFSISQDESNIDNNVYPSPTISQGTDGAPAQTPNQNLVYTNIECGYQLTFTESWRGYFIVAERVPDSNPYKIHIHFYGQSKTGSVIYQELGCDGLPIFLILSEEELNTGTYDNPRYIGVASDIKFYFATSTGSDISILLSRQGAETDEDELQLMKQDWEKFNQMYIEIDSILKTFKAIE